MAYSFNPASWTTGYSPTPSDFQAIAADIATRGDNLDFAHYGAPNCAFLTLVPGERPGNSYSVTAGSWTGGTATLTIGAHNIQVNQHVSISSVTPSGYNSTDAVVTAVTGTQIKYAVGSNPGAWSSGGTVLVDKLATPTTGMLAVNAVNSGLEYYYGSGWVSILQSTLLSAIVGNDQTVAGLGDLTLTGTGGNGRFTAPNQPHSLAYQNGTGQSIADSTLVTLTFDTNLTDNAGIHSASVNTDRFTCPAGQGGLYMIFGNMAFPANTTNDRSFDVYYNNGGGDVLIGQSTFGSTKTGSFYTAMDICIPYILAPGDIIRFKVFQNSGGTLVMQNTSEFRCGMYKLS